jgi:methylthioribose-1-phosphate isomerase
VTEGSTPAPKRSVWPIGDRAIGVIDQTRLPFAYAERELRSAAEVESAIRLMVVRGAPLIGACAAYGYALALRVDPSPAAAGAAFAALLASRPTAVNLRWALERVRAAVAPRKPAEQAAAAWIEAGAIADEDIALNRRLGAHGAALIAARHRATGRRVEVLTHCNAGRLATVACGTALAPIYDAFDAGIPLHVWVDETRPRNQGLLTSWELADHGVPHTLIADNAGGHLMQRGQVDLVLVGADRVTTGGDVCNKIGTYLKAVAAHDQGVPFYAAVPSPTIDATILDALREIPIEDRDGDELRLVTGDAPDGPSGVHVVRLAPRSTAVVNPGFDVTPARLVTGIITEWGVARPGELAALLCGRSPPAVG